MAKSNKSNAATVSFGEYEGNTTLVFSGGPDDNRPFAFGKGKGSRMLAGIDAIGVEAFVDALRKLCGEAAAPKVAKGTDKAKRAPGRPRKVG